MVPTNKTSHIHITKDPYNILSYDYHDIGDFNKIKVL